MGKWYVLKAYNEYLRTYLLSETIQVAKEQGTHFLELHDTSIKYITAIGPDAAHRLNRSPEDNTRTLLSLNGLNCLLSVRLDLNENGTIVFGR